MAKSKRILYTRMHDDGSVDEKEYPGDDEFQKIAAEAHWFPKDRIMPQQFSTPKTDFSVEELEQMLAAKKGLEPQASKTIDTVLEDIKNNPPKNKNKSNAQKYSDNILKSTHE